MYKLNGLHGLNQLIGKTIQRVFINESYLKFVTNEGDFCFGVEGECCSSSIFYDFFGVKNLIGSKVSSVAEIELIPGDISEDGDYLKDQKGEDNSIEVYGYKINAENSKWGEITAVFSFRNYSNGYYGGSLHLCGEKEVQPEVFDDVPLTS